MTKARIQELEEHVSRLEIANRDLHETLQDAQQAAIDKATADAAENLRLRKQLISSQRMLRMFTQPPPSADVVEAPAEEEEAPEPPKQTRASRRRK